MSAPGKHPSNCAFFRLRCAAGLLLAAGVYVCAMKALEPVPRAVPGGNGANPPLTEASTQETGSDPLEIVIDPGHGGGDPGTTSHGQSEKTWTLSIGQALAKELRARGWQVALTRETDAFLPLPDRSTLANQKPRLAFISIHFNSGGPEATGIETYYGWPRQPGTMAKLRTLLEIPDGQSFVDDRSRLLAEALQTRLCAATGAKDREVHNDPALSVTGRTICPAVLVELGFLTNAAECRRIQTEAYRQKLVEGLADGLESWLRDAAVTGYGIQTESRTAAVPVTGQRADKNP